jgi:hypothetical protein
MNCHGFIPQQLDIQCLIAIDVQIGAEGRVLVSLSTEMSDASWQIREK